MTGPRVHDVGRPADRDRVGQQIRGRQRDVGAAEVDTLGRDAELGARGDELAGAGQTEVVQVQRLVALAGGEMVAGPNM
jgi:hypothetical protein